jgi:hypothetical protein
LTKSINEGFCFGHVINVEIVAHFDTEGPDHVLEQLEMLLSG